MANISSETTNTGKIGGEYCMSYELKLSENIFSLLISLGKKSYWKL